AADVMLVTALRDGMNLVAKEYVACRKNDDGAPVPCEFTGAAEQLKGAVMINRHDIGNLKAGILEAVEMDERTRRRRMRQLRKKVTTDTVSLWSENFLAELTHIKHNPEAIVPDGPVVPKRRTAAAADSPAAPSDRATSPKKPAGPPISPPPARSRRVTRRPTELSPVLTPPAEVDLHELITADSLLIALDFDGVLAPLQDDPQTSRMDPASAAASVGPHRAPRPPPDGSCR